MLLPLPIAEFVFGLPFFRRPAYLAKIVPETPLDNELSPDLLLVEIREGHLKWVHLRCPKCGDQIQLPMAGKDCWNLRVDFLRRPTLSPSIWERQTCGAHFFVRHGNILGC